LEPARKNQFTEEESHVDNQQKRPAKATAERRALGMGKVKKAKRFAAVKRTISNRDPRL
jgi:hypothetical protein